MQELIECFGLGEKSDHFGLNASVRARLSSSFNNFSSHVNHRLSSSTITLSRRVSHYSSNLRHFPTSSGHSSRGYSNCSNHSMSPQQPLYGTFYYATHKIVHKIIQYNAHHINNNSTHTIYISLQVLMNSVL